MALNAVCGGGASPNTLAYIKNQQLNLGNYKTSGLDFTATWQGAATDWGRFNVGYRGTYVMTYEYQLEKDAAYNDNLGNYFNGNPIARYRQLLNFGWQKAAWSSSARQPLTSSYTRPERERSGQRRCRDEHLGSGGHLDRREGPGGDGRA